MTCNNKSPKQGNFNSSNLFYKMQNNTMVAMQKFSLAWTIRLWNKAQTDHAVYKLFKLTITYMMIKKWKLLAINLIFRVETWI